MLQLFYELADGVLGLQAGSNVQVIRSFVLPNLEVLSDLQTTS